MIDEKIRKEVEELSDNRLHDEYYSMLEYQRAIAAEYFYRLIVRMD